MIDTQWTAVGQIADMPLGSVKAVEVAGREIAIYHLSDGTLYATDNICTHGFARLSEGFLEENVIECPVHGGQFDVRTGKGLCPPIIRDLAMFEVRISGTVVLVRCP